MKNPCSKTVLYGRQVQITFIMVHDVTPKILIVGSTTSGPQSLEVFYRNAFESLGHRVHMTAVKPKYGWRQRVRQRIARMSYRGLAPDSDGELVVREAEEFRPDLTIVFRGECLKASPVARLRELSSLGCINIYTDSPFVIPGSGAAKMMPTLAMYSCVYTFSRGLIPAFEQLGASCTRWLPFGFDPEMHHIPSTPQLRLRSTVAYLGAWGPLQEAWLEPLAPFGLGIYGPGWRHAQRNSPARAAWQEGRGIGPEMAAAIAGADIVFNMVRAEHGCAHSMKTFEIPACGGFMLTNWTEEQAEFFEDDKHCAFFHTREEMLDKATYYAANADARNKVAVAGHAEARKHPYALRAAQILKDCDS